jgi:hypothetical protein
MSKIKFAGYLNETERTLVERQANRRGKVAKVAAGLLFAGGLFGFLHGVEMETVLSIQGVDNIAASANEVAFSNSITVVSEENLYDEAERLLLGGGSALVSGMVLYAAAGFIKNHSMELRARHIVQQRIQPTDVHLHESINV